MVTEIDEGTIFI